jgi:hypothetical protein
MYLGAFYFLEFGLRWSFDLSPSTSACSSEAIFVCGRSKCREGVTEIESGQNGGLSIAPFINVICTVLAENIHCLPIAQGSYNSAVSAEKMP